MPNGNLSVTTICPRCQQSRLARGDVVRKSERLGRQLFCKPCRNRVRFQGKSHPTKGTGIKNCPEMAGAYKSYMRAKRRVAQGRKHHPAYEEVEFRFRSFDEFFEHLGPRPDNHSVDRIDPLGHYEIGNVRWATVQEQAKNRMPRNYWMNAKKETGQFTDCSKEDKVKW